MCDEVRFICDAMLGGLARWLRAAGYRAAFDVHIQDGALVRRALEEDRCMVTSDSGIMERYAVAEGLVKSVYLPPGMRPLEQLSAVMADLGLQLRAPRCMDCGGRLEPVSLASVRGEVPPKVRRCCDEFFRCSDCEKPYWHGTHWEDIRERLIEAERRARRSRERGH